jgi:hypothetical protein
MAYVAGNKVVARSNHSPANPAGKENMSPGNPPPQPMVEACYLGGAKTVTIERADDTATGSSTAHGFSVNDIVIISGADQAGYNDRFRVATTADANTFTFTVYGSPTTPATGTITAKKLLANAGD